MNWRSYRHTRLLSRIAAVVLVTLVSVACSSGGDDVEATATTTAPSSTARSHDIESSSGSTTTTTEDPNSPPFTAPKMDYNASSCNEDFTALGLARRAFAFDGTVIEFQKGETRLNKALFEVNEWLANYDPQREPDRLVVLVERVVTPGERLLVSGSPLLSNGRPLDQPVAWECGFTVEYSAATAVKWREIFDFKD